MSRKRNKSFQKREGISCERSVDDSHEKFENGNPENGNGLVICSSSFSYLSIHFGVQASTIHNWLKENKIYASYDGEKESDNIFKKMAVGFKSLNFLSATQTKVSAEETVETPLALEDLDWNEYEAHTVHATGYTAGYESTGKKPGDQAMVLHILDLK